MALTSKVRYRYNWNHDNSDVASAFVVVVNANYTQYATYEVVNDGSGSHNCEIVVPQGQYCEVQIMTRISNGTLSAPVSDAFYSDVDTTPVPPNAPFNLSRMFVQFEN